MAPAPNPGPATGRPGTGPAQPAPGPVQLARCGACGGVGVIDYRRSFVGPDGRAWPYHHACPAEEAVFLADIARDPRYQV